MVPLGVKDDKFKYLYYAEKQKNEIIRKTCEEIFIFISF